MGDPTHMAKIDEGVTTWNLWRKDNPRIQPDLTHKDLSNRNLAGVDFRGVGLYEANLSGAKLIGANLRQSRLVRTNFDGADLTGAKLYGASVWDVSLTGTTQRDLVITPRGAPVLTVDDLEVAQFIYLLINNRNLRKVIDTVTSRVVLILGRFKPKRKLILDFVKSELRNEGFVPVLFDFEGPKSRDLTETVSTLAHLSRFVIADLTDPSCIPHELMAIVPNVQIPFLTIIERGAKPYAMFAGLPPKYFWVRPPIEYGDVADIRDVVLPQLLSDAEGVRARIHP